MKYLAIIMLIVSMVSAQKQRTDRMINTKLMRTDTVYVTGTGTAYTPIFWQAKANEKTIEIIMDDTSSAGYASDSASVSVTVKQVFDMGLTKSVNLYNSDAYTSGLLYDSVTIADLDTVTTWLRETAPIVRYGRDTTGYYATDALDTLTTREASAYVQLVPDYSPGLVLLITGLTDNKVGSANRVIIRWYQQQGLPVFDD